jgi:glutamine synthetase
MAEQQRSVDDILAAAEAAGVRFVSLEFTDVVSMAKAVTIPLDQFPDTLERGKWFDGSSLESFARIAESDMYLRPDPNTFTIIPWHDGKGTMARVICDVVTPNGDRFEGDPRAALIRALEDAAAAGYDYYTAPELEFFLFQTFDGSFRPLPHDRGGYFDLTTDLAAAVRREIVDALLAMGIAIEASHHEVAAGQHELDFAFVDALRSADALMTGKYALKAIAQRHDLQVTFLPKPLYGVSGSGMHTHQQLRYHGSGENAFMDPEDQEYGLSAVAKHFIAGQLAHARALCAIVAPLVNSYKRLVPGYEAPVMVSWGQVNREALVRVPRVRGTELEQTRVELRSPDPSCNPYLAFAAMLEAGLDGVRRRLPLPAPVEESLYMLDESVRRRRQIGLLPMTLGEALDELRRDEVMREALGEHIYERFIEAKSIEWAEYCQRVHKWELERYLPAF